MFGWAAIFALMAIASGIAGFGGYARPRGELAVTLCMFAIVASAAFTFAGVRRRLRKKKWREDPPVDRHG